MRTFDDYDDRELDVASVFTASRVLERGGVRITAPFLMYLELIGGELRELRFETAAAVGSFLACMTPRKWNIYVGNAESELDIRGAIEAGMQGEVH